MKTILVAGGAGFIGSHLCQALLAKGEKVICVDNLITGREENLAAFRRHPSFSFVQHDVTIPLAIREPLDEVYNLASPASPVGYQKAPLATLYTNSWGVKNLLELSNEKNATFLQTSTSEVYGDPQEHPQRESYWGHVNPIGPRSCYDEGKRFAESLIVNFAKVRRLPTKIVRIFNTYGPQMALDDGRAIITFLRQALRGEPLTVYGDGHQTRSFCYVADMVEGLQLMMGSAERGPINLGNPVEFTILDLAHLILKITGSASPLSFKELPVDDPQQRRPDITLAIEKLGWVPKVSLEEGLPLTIPDLRKRLADERR